MFLPPYMKLLAYIIHIPAKKERKKEPQSRCNDSLHFVPPSYPPKKLLLPKSGVTEASKVS